MRKLLRLAILGGGAVLGGCCGSPYAHNDGAAGHVGTDAAGGGQAGFGASGGQAGGQNAAGTNGTSGRDGGDAGQSVGGTGGTAGLDGGDASCSGTDSDSSNCGRCGHSCLGGSCLQGVCQPFVLGTATDDYVRDTVISNGNVYVPTDKVGGGSRVWKLDATAYPPR